ncbi:hypothetical protein C0991_002476 [Blastosporella zonata]|nr:hypothetical protein C0991_002476 [Blastosporella zonata]
MLFGILSRAHPVATCSIVVKNLHETIDNKALWETATGFGAVRPTDADKARDALDGSVLVEKKVKVDVYLNSQEQEAKLEKILAEKKANFTRIFVNNLSPKVTQEEYKALFEAYGQVEYATISINHKNGDLLPFGFVNFTTHAAAQAAIDSLHDTMHHGQKLAVDRARITVEREEERKVRLEARRTSFTSLYVNNVDPAATEDELLQLFSPHGTVLSARIQPSSTTDASFAFIHYDTHNAAQNALSAIHDSEHRGRKLSVSRLRNKEERQNEAILAHRERTQGLNLIVRNLSPEVTDDALRAAFEGFGTVSNVKVVMDKDGVSKGHGFVSFKSQKAGAKAKEEMKDKTIGDSQNKIAVAFFHSQVPHRPWSSVKSSIGSA